MNKSFTLIEILVVIVVIGVLSAFILVGMSSITSSASIAKGQAFSNSLRNSLLINLVSEWKLDESSGTTAYDSWGTNNGTLSDISGACGDINHCPQIQSTGCVSGKCLLFDGTNDYVNCTTNYSLNPNNAITIDVWVKFNSLSGSQTIIFRNGPYRIQMNGGYFVYGLYNTTWVTQTSSTLLSDDVWYNVAMTWSSGSGNIILYLNGINNSSIPMTGSMPTLSTETILGSDNPIYNRWFLNGFLDEVTLYKEVLSVSQIQQTYFVDLSKLFKNYGMVLNEFNQRLSELKYNLANNE